MIDIHGLKPLEDVSGNLHLLFFAAVLTILLLAFGAWYSWKRRKKPGPMPRSLAPDREALENLQTLEEMRLIKKGEFKQHFFLLSEIFRQYLERRFAFPAGERTSEEIAGELAALQVAEPLRSQIRAFLGHMDLVKFARAACTPDEARAETDRVRRFITATAHQNPTRKEEEHVAVQ